MRTFKIQPVYQATQNGPISFDVLKVRAANEAEAKQSGINHCRAKGASHVLYVVVDETLFSRAVRLITQHHHRRIESAKPA